MTESPFRYLSNIYGLNHYELDYPLKNVMKYFGQDMSGLGELGNFAGRDLYEIAEHVDRQSKPVHIMWGINGERVDRALLDPSERWALERLMTEFRVNYHPYNNGDWHRHFTSIYLVSDPGMGCILTITNQTAYAISKYGNDKMKDYFEGLTGQNGKVLYGATWFTELQGGSDLGQNLVSAAQHNGKWKISGDTKYFASGGGLAGVAIVSARPEGAQEGAKGLGLFLVPEFNESGGRNFKVRRLKEKSGTVGVPTGEVEFNDSEAFALGDISKGIYYIMENLMISRLSNAMAALGIARKAYLESYYYAQKRVAFGKKLIEHPLILRDLMDMEVYLEGTMALAFKAVDEFQKTFGDKPPYSARYHYARMLTHIAKNLTADMASYVTRMAMELHGGLGFLSEFPIERLHREALITPIWEGPSNIQALDMLEAMVKKGSHKTFIAEMELMRKDIREGMDAFDGSLKSARSSIDFISSVSGDDPQFFAKDLVNTLGHTLSAALLIHMGNVLHLPTMISAGKFYFRRFVERKDYSPGALADCAAIVSVDKPSKEGDLK